MEIVHFAPHRESKGLAGCHTEHRVGIEEHFLLLRVPHPERFSWRGSKMVLVFTFLGAARRGGRLSGGTRCPPETCLCPQRLGCEE